MRKRRRRRGKNKKTASTALIAAVKGGVKCAIHAHPMITKELTGSVTKRIVGQIVSSGIKVYIPKLALFTPIPIYKKPQAGRGLLFSVIV